MRLYVGRLWFEGNRFSPAPTGAAQFRQREWLRGDAALDAARGTSTELAAVAALADAIAFDTARGGAPAAADTAVAAGVFGEIVVGRCASASPGGPIDDAVFDAFAAETLGDLAQAKPAAIYLSLHGAAITASRDHPEIDLLVRLREHHPEVPVAASFDLHANLDPRLVSLVDFATVYRTHPHVDMRETAARALSTLAALASARSARRRPAAPAAPPTDRGRLHGAIVKLGALVPSFNMRSATEPMRGLQALARAAEGESGVVDAAILGGFPYADTASADGSVMVWATTVEAADRCASTLAAAYRARLPAFAPALVGAREGLRRADAMLGAAAATASPARAPRPIAITDPADNPLSGGGATTTTLLAELLRARTEPDAATPAIAALPAGSIVFAYLLAPHAVATAHREGIGHRMRLAFDAQGFGPALEIDVRVVSVGDGRFVNAGPMEHGARVDAGPVTVVDAAGVHLVLASTVCAANDPGFFTCNGIDPLTVRLLCVKAKNHFHGAFGAICEAIVDVDCPGPAAADLSTLAFRHWPAHGTRPPSPARVSEP
ncbi:MAG: M81 family metallopeptidase [Lautropia sp.]